MELHTYNEWFLASDRVLTIQPHDHQEALPCTLFGVPLPATDGYEGEYDFKELQNSGSYAEDFACLRAEINPTNEASNVYDIPDNFALFIGTPDGGLLEDLAGKHFSVSWSKR